MELTYWYLFPIAILIATLASSAGIGGATFFSPFLLIVLGLPPEVAIGTALATEVFGFTSGVFAHARAHTIDWLVARRLATVAVPAGVVGSLLSGAVPATLLKTVLGLGLLTIAVVFIRHDDSEEADASIARGEGVVEPSQHRVIVARDGETFDYRLCRHREGQVGASVGGLFVGLISTGLGELNSYALVKRCRIPTRVTLATSVAVVAATALAASVTHLADLAASSSEDLETVRNIVTFTIPGVIIGGQLGPLVDRRVDGDALIRALGWLFVAIGSLTLLEAWVG